MKKGKFKQILALVLTAATVTAPLLGCQNGGEQKESENTAESTEPATDGETAPSEEPTDTPVPAGKITLNKDKMTVPLEDPGRYATIFRGRSRSLSMILNPLTASP